MNKKHKNIINSSVGIMLHTNADNIAIKLNNFDKVLKFYSRNNGI